MDFDKFTFKEILENINQWIETDVINPEDIPSIELYMDQVTTFMDKELARTKRHPDDKILTKTMINNYSKNDLLPPSNKKKYSKDHIILLIYIYYMKNFLSISDIKTLLTPMTERYFNDLKEDNTGKSSLSMSDIYGEIYNLEKKYTAKLQENIDEICDIADSEFKEDSEYLKAFALVSMLSYDIYAKKQLIEHLLDSITTESSDNNSYKELKAKKKKPDKQAKSNE